MGLTNQLKGQNIIKLGSDTDKAKAIAILGISAVIIYIIYKTSDGILSAVGITKSESDKKKEKEQEKVIDLTKDQIKTEEKKGNKPSYHPAQYLKSALIIQNATRFSAIDDDNKTAIDELLRYTPKDVDYYELQQAFGSKDHAWFGMSRGPRTLVELLQQELYDSEKKRINSAWANRKMQSRVN